MVPTANTLDDKGTKAATAKDSSSSSNTPNRSRIERSSSKSPQPSQSSLSPQKSIRKTNMIVTTNNSSTSSSFKCNLKCKKSTEETFVWGAGLSVVFRLFVLSFDSFRRRFVWHILMGSILFVTLHGAFRTLIKLAAVNVLEKQKKKKKNKINIIFNSKLGRLKPENYVFFSFR